MWRPFPVGALVSNSLKQRSCLARRLRLLGLRIQIDGVRPRSSYCRSFWSLVYRIDSADLLIELITRFVADLSRTSEHKQCCLSLKLEMVVVAFESGSARIKIHQM